MGGVFNRWEFVTAGDPIERVKYVEHHTQPGQIVVSPEAWQLISKDCLGEADPERHCLLKEVHIPTPPPAVIRENRLPEAVLPALCTYISGANGKR